MATVNWSLQHKRDTAANWTSNNPTLLAGQLGIETDGLTTTPKFKIGDGVTAWATLPYFYGGALSAQNLNNVLTVGNTTAGKNIVLTDDDIIQVGSTANRKIGFNTSTIAGGLELVNLNSNDHIILQDVGGIHVDTTYVQLPQVTASRILATDASNKITGAYTTTGSGTVLALSTSPTFTTDITTPLVIGGSAVGSNITYKSTSGTGTTTAAAHTFTGGTNGGTTIATLYNNGNVNIGNYASPNNLRLVTIGQDTAYMSFGSLVGATNYGAIYINQPTPSVSNYALAAISGQTLLNGVNLSNGGLISFRFDNTAIITAYGTASTGAVTNFSYSKPSTTNQTASTAINGVLWTLGSRQWANGGGATTIATQKEFELTTPTYLTSGGGSLTFTSAYTFYVSAPTASGVTITNNYAAGFSGNIYVDGATGSSIFNNSGGSNTLRVQRTSGTVETIVSSQSGGSFLGSSTAHSTNIQSSGITRISFAGSGTGDCTVTDAVNFILGSTTGHKFGTATTQKLSFWNATPIVQPTTAVAAATFVANTSGIVNDTATFDGYTIGQIVKALRNTGLLA